MKEFLGKDFMLNSDIAKVLYHEYVEKMPIYDYHCHLSAKEIYEDRRFDSITDLWLVEGHFGDHYKWRAMRANGVSEKYITGDASKKDKFLKWAETIPYTVGNPLYIWTHLELRKYFGIYENFSPKNASSIYDSMNETLKTLTARKIIENSNVDTICTTDDPIDDLRYHKLLKEDKSFKVHVYPAFRPDKLLNIDWDSFLPYIESLSNVVGYKVNNLATLKSAIKERIEFFHENGCRISDHALDKVVYEKTNDEEVDAIIQKRINGETITDSEVKKYRGYLLVLLGKNGVLQGGKCKT